MLKSLILLLVMVGTGRAQTDKLRAEILALYTPVDLKNDTDLARAARYFAVVKNKPNLPDYVEALRAQLEDSRDRARMLPHGTATLLFLSDAPENLAFAVRMLARMDFREVRVFDYYTILTRLVRKNVDVSLAVFRLLAIPDVRLDFSFSPSLNGFSYDQADLVAGLLVPTSEAFWADQAIERLATESDPVRRRPCCAWSGTLSPISAMPNWRDSQTIPKSRFRRVNSLGNCLIESQISPSKTAKRC